MIPGFASAQRAYENMTPFESDCDCPPLFMCPECDKLATEAGECCKDADDVKQFHFEEIDREDCQEFALANCPRHGWCTGCASRNCEDCNG